MNSAHGSCSPELLLSHVDFVQRLARQLAEDAQDAEDVTQDTLAAAVARGPGSPSGLRAWLAAVARNCVRQLHRGEVRREARERRAAVEERLPSTADVLAREALRTAVVNAVLALAEPARTALLMRFYDGLPPRRIAALLRVPVETVRTRIKRGLTRLREDLLADPHVRQERSLGAALRLLAGPGRTAEPASSWLLGVAGKAAAVCCFLLAAVLGWWLLPAGSPPAQPPPAGPPPVLAEPRALLEPGARREESATATRVATGGVPAPASQAAPEGTLVITVAVADAEPLIGFEATLHRGDGRVMPDRTTTERLVKTVPLTGPGGDEFEITVFGPNHGGARTRVRVLPGGRQEVKLVVSPRQLLTGTVVDARGAPLSDALVFFGNVARLRGDEPFKPFALARVHDGVRTDAAGRFTLDGAGDLVTAFHERATPATVGRALAERITLPDLGAIDGRLVDADGRGRAGVAIALDREQPVTTDADGAFRFSEVKAGVRGLCLPGKVYVGVTVEPGRTARVELGRDLAEVTIAVAHPRLTGTVKNCVLIGEDPVAAVLPCEVNDGRVVVKGARPGAYVLYSRDGPVARVALAGPLAEAVVGTAELAVEGPPGRRVSLVPAGTRELFEVLAPRVSGRSLAADGTTRFPVVVPGEYLLVEEPVGASGGRSVPVAVRGPSSKLRLE